MVVTPGNRRLSSVSLRIGLVRILSATDLRIPLTLLGPVAILGLAVINTRVSSDTRIGIVPRIIYGIKGVVLEKVLNFCIET